MAAYLVAGAFVEADKGISEWGGSQAICKSDAGRGMEGHGGYTKPALAEATPGSRLGNRTMGWKERI